MIAADKIYSPQNYLELVTDNCYIIDGDNDLDLINNILKQNGYNNLRHFALNDIEHVADKDISVVLVECLVCDEEDLFNKVYYWYEIPKGVRA